MEIAGIKEFIFSNRVDIEEVSAKFESLFFSYIIKGFQEMVPESESLGDGLGSPIFQSIIGMQLADELSKAYRMGLGHTIFANPGITPKLAKETYELNR